MSFDFNFTASGYTPPAGDEMDFLFGPVDVPLAEVTVAGTIPGPTMTTVINVLVDVQITGTLPGLTASFDLSRTIALLFEDPAPASTDLVFGEGAAPGGETGDTTNVTLTGTLPAPSFDAFIGETVEVELAATLPGITFVSSVRPSVPVGADGLMPGLVMSVEVRYATNTARPTVGQTTTDWQETDFTHTGATTGQQDSTPHPTGWNTPWQLGADSRSELHHPLPDVFQRAYEGWNTDFQQATHIENERGFDHQNGDRTLRLAINDAYEAAARLRHSRDFLHEDGDRTKRGTIISWWQVAQPFKPLGQDNRMSTGVPFSEDWWTRFQDAMRPVPGLSYPPVTPPPQPGFTCYDPNGDLLFETPWSAGTNLVFFCADGTLPPPPPGPEGPVVVPVKRVYIVLNTTSLRRVSDNALVPTISMSLSLDVDSWSWSFSASLPGVAQALVEPTTGPVELKAMVNGTEFRVLAESVSRERVFGQTSIRVSGRGRNAVLDAPYVPSLTFGNTSSRTAQQLMGDVLTFNGVPLGWAVNWELTDWVVPAGVFNHQGSYISALNAIVGAAGGYLLPHPSAMSFTVKHRYPTAPWAWGSVTPDFELPAAVTSRESLEWREKPVYNRVYVSGQQNGILGRVTRTTTDGALLAPMVVDPLITAVDAARQRGRAILSDTGRQIGVGLRLPVLAETGVIQPGAFVEYVDGGTTRLGLVRGTSLEIGHPDVWQTLEVETHE